MTRKADPPYGITPSNYPEFMARCSEHMVRKGKDMAGYFIEMPDPEALIYEVYEAECQGNTCSAITVLKAGRVGNEYFMTKGHFHEDADSGETYIGLKGEGMILMQTGDGRTDEIPLAPGTVVCIPPGWAHRTVNTGREDLIMVAVFPAVSGHDYGSIQEKGFIKRVVEREGKPTIV